MEEIPVKGFGRIGPGRGACLVIIKVKFSMVVVSLEVSWVIS
jgi:hypothetical protein